MRTRIRGVVLAVASALGLVAAIAGPAAAGRHLNHALPKR